MNPLGVDLNNKERDGVIEKKTKVAFALFLVYLVSFFLHLPSRISILGAIRLDFILVGVITFLILSSQSKKGTRIDDASKYLLAILLYAIITIPLVQWPGSVLNKGIIEFIKAAIFYFFTVNLVVSERRLKAVISFFVACNVIRILEPLLLNITSGYLGSVTHLGGGEFAGRLSGAPSDIVNPNGLAFIIATVFPFLHYVFAPSGKKAFFIYALLIPVLLYAMGLTLSRSGILALGIIAFGIWVKSKYKFRLLMLGLVGLLVIGMNLNEIQKDRYLSLVSDDARQSASAEGRIDGWSADFKVAMNRPIIGHGLGTSREANWNVRGKDQISHILWAEIWQEIGMIGLLIFVLYLKSMVKNFREAASLIKISLGTNDFLFRCSQAMQVWLLMNLLFSLASYGLKSYEWYFFGGLSVALLNITKDRIANSSLGAEKDFSVGPKTNEKFILAKKVR
ncbi:O-antigen ligase family protein [Marinobacter litoralis]|uniref:O-antigen ligase family protein n=1 Tax=Marinobacter litoralis TaxID=187981 RepID=UPI0018EB19E1|nr:O-antigen ligase family protein [Marinobacter litoralis]MBJ6137694.1 O-antigen ligase family protein [Marinobacter litoralis]